MAAQSDVTWTQHEEKQNKTKSQDGNRGAVHLALRQHLCELFGRLTRLLLKYKIFAAHLAGTGCLGVQCVDEGANSDGQRVFKNRQLGLKRHMHIKTQNIRNGQSTVNLPMLQCGWPSSAFYSCLKDLLMRRYVSYYWMAKTFTRLKMLVNKCSHHHKRLEQFDFSLAFYMLDIFTVTGLNILF